MTKAEMTKADFTKRYDVIIIGSGISGLTAGSILREQGKSVLILDKGRRIGGRCSTKRFGQEGEAPFIANHGAQFFTAKENDFLTLTKRALAAKACQIWDFGHHQTSYAGMPTMRDFASFIAQDASLEIEQDVTITAIKRTKDIYQLSDSTQQSYQAQSLILTAPAPQAALLVKDCDTNLAKTAASASYDPCWTVMLGLSAPLHTLTANPDNLSLPLREAGDIGWANYEPLRQADAIAAYQPCLTIQASPQASREMLEWDKAEVISHLQSAFEAQTNTTLSVQACAAHRWLYARVATPAQPDLPFISADKSLALAGDYFGKARLESAYLSGRRAALALR